MMPIKRCPVCGDYVEWCVSCGVAAVEENTQEETIDETEYYLWMDEQIRKDIHND